jgi:hypothetical protein
MGLGLLVNLLGSARFVLGMQNEPFEQGTISGVIGEFISGSTLLLYRSNFKRLGKISSQLDSTWRILAAYKMACDLPESEQKDAILPIISVLARLTKI